MGYSIAKFAGYIKEKPGRSLFVIFVYSFIIALLIVGLHSHFNEEDKDLYYMGGRQQIVNTCMEQLRSGAPVSISILQDHIASFYFYSAYIGHLFGKSSAWESFLFIQLFMVFILFLVFPVMVYKITRSFLLSLISPILIYQMLGFFLVKNKDAHNWILIWVIVLSVPLLYIYFKETKFSLFVFIGLCLITGVSNVFRAHSSLFVALIVIAISFYKQVLKNNGKAPGAIEKLKKIFLFAGIAVTVCCFYYLFTNIFLFGYALKTHQSLTIPYFDSWHTTYIGLGWEHNPFGIYFNDQCAFDAVKDFNPNIPVYSEEYFKTLKMLYVNLFKEHPLYFFLTYTKKIVACFVYIFYFILTKENGIITFYELFFIFMLACYVLPQKCSTLLVSIIKKYCIIYLFCIILLFGMLIYPLMAEPGNPYILGSMTAYNMLLFFLMIALLENCIAFVKDKCIPLQS